MHNLKHKTLHGVFWMFASTGGQQVANFVIMLVLARNLGPVAFGLVGLATVMVDILSLIGRAGLTEVLIQNRDTSQEELSTVFWTSLFFGSTLGAVCFLGASALAEIFSEPDLTVVLRLLSITCVFNTLGTVHEALLRSSFGFKALALRNFSATVVSGFVAIVLAADGFGAMSLVVQRIIATLWLTVALWLSMKWWPSFQFSKVLCLKQLRLGGAIVGSSLLGTGNQRLIDLLVGYFLGTTSLGYLRIAWKSLDLLLNICVVPASSVIFTSLSHLQSNPVALARAYQRMVQFTSLIIYPVFLGSAVIAPELVVLAFGHQWDLSIPLMQLFTLMVFFVPLAYYRNNILLASGHADQVLKLSIISFIVSVIVSLIAVQFGIEATAFGNTLRVALITPITLSIIQKYTGARAIDTLKGGIPPAVSSTVMVCGLLILRGTGVMPTAPVLSIAVSVFVGAGLYLLTLSLLFRSCWQEMLSFVKTNLRPARR